MAEIKELATMTCILLIRFIYHMEHADLIKRKFISSHMIYGTINTRNSNASSICGENHRLPKIT
jgi:hypothetical protein